MRSEGMLRNSTGTSTARSMSRCPASQSPTAITSATTLSPMLLPPSETIFSQNTFLQLSTDSSVEPGADFHVLIQPHLALQYDQAADPFCREIDGCLSDLLDNILAALYHAFGRAEKRGRANLGQRPPDVALEYNDDDENDRTQEVVDYPIQSEQT